MVDKEENAAWMLSTVFYWEQSFTWVCVLLSGGKIMVY